MTILALFSRFSSEIPRFAQLFGPDMTASYMIKCAVFASSESVLSTGDTKSEPIAWARAFAVPTKVLTNISPKLP
jgi:hypothetical protein